MPDFDFSSLITDRSQSDVDALRALLARGKAKWTAEELAEFNLARSKGSYNYTDLNRVTACMDYLAGVFQSLGYQVPGYKKVEIPRSTSRLPDGYTELEYIESSGTQYVNTGFKHNQDTRVVMDVQATSISANAWAFEGRITNNSARHGVFFYYTSGDLWNMDYSGSTRISFSGISSTSRLLIDYNKNTCSINGVTRTATSETFQSTVNLTLLAANTGGTIAGYLQARLYSCQIYDNGVLVRDFVPCMAPSGEVGLYDLVGQQFYGNAGTGNFIGSPVPVELPDGYTQVEYIESSGTQYVDTQLSAPNGFRASFRVQFNSLTGMLSGVIGAHNPTAPYGRNLFSASSEKYEVGQGDGFYDFGLPLAGEMIRVDFSNTVDDPYCYINNEPINMVPTVPGSGSFTSKTLFLFAINGGQTWYQNLIGRLGEIKLYEGNELVRDYIPCKNSSGIIGFYDLVSEEFYRNAGTGEFIAGSTVEPPFSPPTYEELDPYTWYEEDIPTISLMETYLDNVTAIRSVLELLPTTPETPESMAALTYEEANDIERILLAVDALITNMINAFFYSNEIVCGEV